MIRYHARWVLPISAEPIRDGWVLVDRGRIVGVGRGPADEGVRTIDLGESAVLPGLVNAHTHLELSYLRDRVSPASAFVTWIRDVMAARREQPDPTAPEIMNAVDAAIEQSVLCGTALVGDISNTLVTWPALARSELGGVLFYELIKFNAPEPEAFVTAALSAVDALARADRLRANLAAHAPYSVAPLVFGAIREALDRRPDDRCSVHLSESAEEMEFIALGSGAWRSLLEDVGAWNPAWNPSGVSPVQYLDEAGFLDSRVIAVHGVQMTGDDLARLKRRGTTLVTCPRSNGHTGAGVPPLRQFYESGVPIAIGTDSLASAPDLSVFAEVATMRALDPEIPASRLLESATRVGARALGLDDQYGTIEAGKRARLLSVAVPASTDDVQEYLVSGVDPTELRWIE